MAKKLLGITLSAFILIACDSNKELETQEFITPRDQYGARYSVGDL